MILKFTKSKLFDLYTKEFYLMSCFANLISSTFAYFILPASANVIVLFGICLFIACIIEAVFKKDDITKKQYNELYSIKIFYQIAITSISLLVLKNECIMYLPVLLSMLYLNVNSIIKSKLIQYSSIIFMLSPLLRVFYLPSNEIFLYLSVCVLFIFATFLSTFIFKNHQEKIDSSDHNMNILKEVYRLTQRHPAHDIKNELTILNLCSHKYHDEPSKFLEQLKESTENIQRYANTNIFENEEVINLENLINDLRNYTSHSSINCFNSFMDRRTIISNRNFLYSVFKNILDNCIQKSIKNSYVGDVILIKKENCFILRDECGLELSDKFKNFLEVIEDGMVKNMFGYNIKIDTLSDGYEYKISFEKVQ
jgi:hypothetical protein